ncbi:MAG TPA: GNAT family N-acetyltransferase [Herpetosiphonaceae bacterium]|nr:GNAT family N-acetyltransferase [Herpetosiphonaceae bacterium]
MADYTNGDYQISTDPARLDLAAIHAYIARSYWGNNRPIDVVARSLQHSLCFGVYRGAEQIGLARVVTDHATFAYLCDVYILEAHQGRGLGKWLISVVAGYPLLQGLRRWSLATRDAHGLYEQYGFSRLSDPDRWMEIYRPTPAAG